MEMRPYPPSISPAERLLLNHLADEWRSSGTWPRQERLFLEYHGRGEDLDALLGALPDAFWRRNQLTRDERIELTIAGLEQCEKGDREVAPFLELVRQVVARFIADRTAPAQVTGEDLTLVLGPGRDDEISRLREFYATAWEGTRGLLGRPEWFLQAGIEDVRLAQVAMGWEYVQLRRARPRVLEKLEDIHRHLLKVIYAAWHETGDWPRAVDAVVQEWQRGDILTYLAEIPHRYLCQMVPSSPGLDRCRLTLWGVALVAPQAEPESYVQMLQAVLRHYKDTHGEEGHTAAAMAERVGIAEEGVRRIGDFFQQDRFSGIHLEGMGTDWRVRADRSILRWEGIEGYAQYAAECERLEREEQERLEQLIAPSPEEQVREHLQAAFDARFLEQPIAAAARDHFVNGMFRDAVLSAAIALEERIRQRTNDSRVGVALMMGVFASQGGQLRLPEAAEEVQEGWRYMLAGAMKSIRNPVAHSLKQVEALDALDRLSTLSLLYRVVEAMQESSRNEGQSGPQED